MRLTFYTENKQKQSDFGTERGKCMHQENPAHTFTLSPHEGRAPWQEPHRGGEQHRTDRQHQTRRLHLEAIATGTLGEEEQMLHATAVHDSSSRPLPMCRHVGTFHVPCSSSGLRCVWRVGRQAGRADFFSPSHIIHPGDTRRFQPNILTFSYFSFQTPNSMATLCCALCVARHRDPAWASAPGFLCGAILRPFR